VSQLAADVVCPLPGTYNYSAAGVSGCADLHTDFTGRNNSNSSGDGPTVGGGSSGGGGGGGGSGSGLVGRGVGVGGMVRGLDPGIARRLLRAAAAGCSSERLPCVLDALGAEESADLAPGVCVRVVCGMRVFVKMGAAVSG